MNDVQGHIISAVIGFFIGKLGDRIFDKAKRIKKDIERQSIVPLNILEEYVKEKEAIPIISFGIMEAIKLEPIMQYGKALLKAKINLEKFQCNEDSYEFVMALLKYIPSSDWKDYSLLNYSFNFKARGTINGLQLEIKNSLGQKLIDEYIELANEFKEYSFDLNNEAKWTDISEICFTVFCADKYITGDKGIFEIMDCYLS